MEVPERASLRTPRRTGSLPETGAPSAPSLKEEVEESIAAVGPQATAEAVRDDLIILQSEKMARIEEVTRQWAQDHARSAWEWIAEQEVSEQEGEDFKQAAISGYLETIALIDPEAAVKASELLASVEVTPTEANTDSADVANTDPFSSNPRWYFREFSARFKMPESDE